MSIKYFFNTHISRKGVYLIIYRVLGRIYFNQFKAMYDPFLRGAQVKSTPYEWEGVGQFL